MKHVLALAAVLALSAGAAHAKSCKDPTTHKFIKCSAATAPASMPTPSAPASTSAPMISKAPGQEAQTGGAPHCTKGKVCGHSCIAMTKGCHKPS